MNQFFVAGEDTNGHMSQQTHDRNFLQHAADVGNFMVLKTESSTIGHGGTPLQNATSQGHLEIVLQLLLEGVFARSNEADITRFHGREAMNITADVGHLSILENPHHR